MAGPVLFTTALQDYIIREGISAPSLQKGYQPSDLCSEARYAFDDELETELLSVYIASFEASLYFERYGLVVKRPCSLSISKESQICSK